MYGFELIRVSFASISLAPGGPPVARRIGKVASKYKQALLTELSGDL